MKILLAGQFKSWAIEHHFQRHLARFAEVHAYPAEDVFDDFYHASILHKIRFRLGMSGIHEKISDELTAKAAQVRPDVVWIFKGMRILPQAIQALKAQGIKVINYNPDHPFLFASRGSGNRNVSRSIGLYDLHFCYSRSLQRRIETEFGIPTAFLPFAFELGEETFQQACSEPEIRSACFIGNADKIRAQLITALAEAGLPVAVYGHGWERMLPGNPNIQLNEAAYGIGFWKKMRAYCLQINIFRPHNEGSHNMRTFEIPAVGGIQLAPDSPEHREFFEVGKEIFLYRNEEELIQQARRILEMPKAEIEQVRKQARQRSLTSGYSYPERVASAFSALEQLFENAVLT